MAGGACENGPFYCAKGALAQPIRASMEDCREDKAAITVTCPVNEFPATGLGVTD